MVKSFRYIIKRIIIGVGIALALMIIKGNLLIGVHAEQMTFGPNDIVVTGQSINTFSSNSLTYNNETVWTVPQNNYITGGFQYNYFFRYPQFNGASYCNQTSNNGSISGRIYGLGFNFINTSTIKFEDVTTGGGYKNCQYTIAGGTATFTCNDINLSHSINIVGGNFYIPNTSDRYGISKIDVNCTMTNEGLANSINNSINNQTNTIINNQNTNTQNIINNQNQNTQQEIESQKVCRNVITHWTRLTYQVAFNTDSISKYPISPGTYTIKWDNSLNAFDQPGLFYYREGSPTNVQVSNGETINFDSNWVLFVARGGGVSVLTDDFLNSVQIINCRNGNQAIADGQQQINDTLNDDTGVSNNDIESLFGEFEDSDSPISDLLTMPITLAQAYLNGFGGTCSAINLGSLYGTSLIIPCIDLEARLGSTLWNLIDVLFSLFMLYNIGMLIVKVFDGITSLNDQFDEAMGRGGN